MTILKEGVDGFIYFSLSSVSLFSNHVHPCIRMCVRGIDICLSMIFQLDFGTGPTVWYFLALLSFCDW